MRVLSVLLTGVVALVAGAEAMAGELTTVWDGRDAPPPTPEDAFAVLARRLMDRPNRISKDEARLYCPFYNYKTTPHAIVAQGNVYCVFQNSEGRPFAMTYDIDEKSWAGPVQISDFGLGRDKHGVPSLCIDGQGHLHVFFGCHVHPMRHCRSVRPYDINAWEKQEAPSKGHATYPGLMRLADGAIYLFYRAGFHLEPWVMQTSVDDCKSWCRPQPVIEMRRDSGDPGLGAYCRFFPGSDGKTIHCFWNLKDDTPTPPAEYPRFDEAVYRYHIYYMRRDPDGAWRNAAGQKVSLPVNKAQAHAKCLVYDSGDRFTLMQYGCRLGVDATNRPYIKFRTGVVDWMRVKSHDINDPRIVVEPLTYRFASFESGEWRVCDRMPIGWPPEAASLICARGVIAYGGNAQGQWRIFWPLRPLTSDKGAFVFLYNTESGYATRKGGPAYVE